jgi:nucleoside-diphosphate-sugar epimerase
MHIIANKNDVANGKIYNIGNPKNNHSVRELANQMLEIARSIPEYAKTAKEVKIVETTSGAYYGEGYQDVQNRVPAIDNTMAELGWKPTTTMTDALKNIFEAYRLDVDKARQLVDSE